MTINTPATKGPMRQPLTADEREARTIEYLKTLNKGQLAEFQLTRLNKVANFRKDLMRLMEGFIESRAESLAAGMLMESAPERTESQLRAISGAVPKRKRARKMPIWLRKHRQVVNS